MRTIKASGPAPAATGSDPRRAEKFIELCFNTPLWVPPATGEEKAAADPTGEPNDEVGTDHAANVAQQHLFGIAESVRIVNLPALPPQGDISDWLENGGDPGRLVGLCEAAPTVSTAACDTTPAPRENAAEVDHRPPAFTDEASARAALCRSS